MNDTLGYMDKIFMIMIPLLPLITFSICIIVSFILYYFQKEEILIKASHTNPYKIGFYLLRNISKKNKIEINMTNLKSSVTKKYEIYGNDTTQIEEMFFARITLNECNHPLEKLCNTINIDYNVNNLDDYEIQNIFKIKFNYSKLKLFQEFKIDSLKHINDTIIINASNNFEDILV